MHYVKGLFYDSTQRLLYIEKQRLRLSKMYDRVNKTN